ncbi:hypothetical protein [Achromobacter xylosoxidans]|uniref:hypothetical protein n=1 Tax=Alcaligenes xylosoxydans xylosoxydans TaxID=85698 RepID=UPI001F12D99A|nr:hypothetical protein [Achromobacter xylosoxidans]
MKRSIGYSGLITNLKRGLPMAESKGSKAELAVERKPASLIDFLERSDSAQVRQASALDVRASVGSVFLGSAPIASGMLKIGKSEENKFVEGVADVVMSKEFTTELSDAIGQPQAAETEDAFVARAKAQMSALIKKKLSK